MTIADVTVRGAGVFGLSIAWACAQRGARVRVIDPNGVAAGASGGIVGALAPHVPEQWNPKKQFQLDALLAAEAFWKSVHEAGGKDPGYARTGRLQPIESKQAIDLAELRGKGAAELWQDHASWTVQDADKDWAPVSPTGLVVYDTLTARLHPQKATGALAAALWRQGIGIETDGPEEGQVVHATGWRGMVELSNGLTTSVGNGVKGQAALLDLDARDKPQIFAQGIHVVPHADGTVAVGSTSERLWDDEHSTDSQLSALLAEARAAVPALAKATVIHRWAGVRPRAKSRAPMLGPHPLRPGQFIANGGFKIGFGIAPKVAEVMADLVLEGKDTIPPDFLPAASGA